MLRIAEQWYASDLGRQRQGNEDNFFVRAPLFVVADGMGGAQAGEVASEIAVRSFDDELPYGSRSEALVPIHKTLLEGDDVMMSGFGNFNIRRKAPRPGRNPRTGEAIPIKARHVVTFHASHKLKGVVQGDTPPADEFE